MQKQTLIFLLFTSIFYLSACSNFKFPGIYKIDIAQGNIVSQDLLDKLQANMSTRQVKYILGSPLVQDTFDSNRWDYYFSLKSGETGKTKSSLVTVFFENSRYSHYKLKGEIPQHSVRQIAHDLTPPKRYFFRFWKNKPKKEDINNIESVEGNMETTIEGSDEGPESGSGS